MKKCISLILAFVFVVGICVSAPMTITANAASVSDLTFKLNEDGQSYYVADCSGDASGEIVVPNIYNGLPVTSIGGSAFQSCTSLTSITIGNSVTSIGDYAFWSCNSLTSITIGNSVTSIGDNAFFSCDFLTSITIPDSITSIGDYAFSSCDSLTSITIGNSVTSIGDYAFYRCTSLEEINVSQGNSVYSSLNGVLFNKAQTEILKYPVGKKEGGYQIPVSITNIANYAFEFCDSLTSVTIPDSVTSIGDYAFSGCDSLKSITIPNGVMSIGVGTFTECTSLTSITIPDSVKDIGANAFAFCISLTSITIPNSVTNIGVGAFFACFSLDLINVCNNNSFYSSVNGVLFDKNKTILFQYPCNKDGNSYEIPRTVCDIEAGAFSFCKNLSIISIADSVTNIGCEAFAYSESLKSITIPDSVMSIGESAFRYCTSLKFAIIGNRITKILESTFRNCVHLKKVVLGDSIKEIGDYAFADTAVRGLKIGKSVTNIGRCAVGYDYDEYEGYIKENDFCIYGEKGSYAEEYADSRSFKFVDLSEHTHNYSTNLVLSPETCVNDGIKGVFCECGQYYSEVIYATGHIEETVGGKEATCSETGCTEGEKCSICDTILSGVELIPALGHNYSNEYTVDKTPTYDEAGSKSRHCTRCDAKTDVTSIPELVRLSAPTITSVTSEQNGVKFTWNEVNGTEGYIIFKLVKNEAGEYVYQQLAVVGPSTLAFTDQTAVDGETYCYAVAAMDEMGNAGQYSEFAHTYKKITTLSTPKVSVKSTSSGVKVSWKAIENAETYTVYRRTYNAKTKKWGDWKKLKSGYTKTSFTDKKAKLGTKYRYTVKAVNGSVKSKYKSTDTIKYNVTPTVKVAKVSNGVKVTWSTAANATSYKIYRSTYNTKTKEWGSWKGLKTAKATSKSYTDKSAKKGVKYRYTVRAVNGSYKSTFKASSSVKR